jgi:hypothetical protein
MMTALTRISEFLGLLGFFTVIYFALIAFA